MLKNGYDDDGRTFILIFKWFLFFDSNLIYDRIICNYFHTKFKNKNIQSQIWSNKSGVYGRLLSRNYFFNSGAIISDGLSIKGFKIIPIEIGSKGYCVKRLLSKGIVSLQGHLGRF